MKKKINYENLFVLIMGLLSIVWTGQVIYQSMTNPLYVAGLLNDDKEINGFIALFAIGTIIHLAKAAKRFSKMK